MDDDNTLSKDEMFVRMFEEITAALQRTEANVLTLNTRLENVEHVLVMAGLAVDVTDMDAPDERTIS